MCFEDSDSRSWFIYLFKSCPVWQLLQSELWYQCMLCQTYFAFPRHISAISACPSRQEKKRGHRLGTHGKGVGVPENPATAQPPWCKLRSGSQGPSHPTRQGSQRGHRPPDPRRVMLPSQETEPTTTSSPGTPQSPTATNWGRDPDTPKRQSQFSSLQGANRPQ